MQKLFSFLTPRFAGIFFFLLTANFVATAQQTVRGKITDAASKSPVARATVVVVGSSPLNGTTTDADGNFRLTKVPIGRIALKITYLGDRKSTRLNSSHVD